ncbi:MAG: hydantoinase B/oxoprolinase family protein [Pseudorhodoplanes sp.]
MKAAQVGEASDPITLQVVKQRLIAVPNLIEKNVERTSFSLLVQEYKDYAVGFVDAKGRLVAQSKHSLPAFVANALGLGVRAGLRELGPDAMNDGDVFIISEAAVLGKHINDVVAYTPVRSDGRLIGFFAVLVHWVDVGGAVVGSCFSPSTTDVFQEGIQYPTVKLISRGERVRDIFRIIETNTRFPQLLMGDIEAQIGGCMMGCEMVREVVTQYGPETILAAIDEMFSDADRAMERAIRSLPPGTYTASSFLDDDGVRHGQRIRVDIAVTLRDGRMIVDMTGLEPQLAGPFNAGREGGAVAVARMAAKFLFAGSTPVNEGDFERVEVVIPEGRFLSASPDAPVGGAGNFSASVVDTIVSALAPAMPERIPAGHHGTYGTHTITGRGGPTGERFLSLDAMSGGWGAFSDQDGPGPYRSMTHGDVHDVPVEVQEAAYPYRIESKQLRVDSGGAGRYRGGLGVEKVYRFLQEVTLLTKIERTACPPWGVEGGMPGLSPGGELVRAGGDRVSLRKGQWAVSAGDVARILSGGGGGYGPAVERNPESVVMDVRMGYVSRECALRDYRVVVGDDGSLDVEATSALRKGADAVMSAREQGGRWFASAAVKETP